MSYSEPNAFSSDAEALQPWNYFIQYTCFLFDHFFSSSHKVILIIQLKENREARIAVCLAF
jgi:hypothetical protein